MARADTHKSADVWRVLAPLAKIAERTGCAILAVPHLNKRSSEGNLIYRFTVSLDFTASARSVMAVGKNPNDPNQRVLAPVKSNHSAPPASLGFHFSEDGWFTWDGVVDLDANAVLAVPYVEEQSAKEEAETYLLDVLSAGRVPTYQVEADAKQAGISDRTLRRARKSLGVFSERTGRLGEKAAWD